MEPDSRKVGTEPNSWYRAFTPFRLIRPGPAILIALYIACTLRPAVPIQPARVVECSLTVLAHVFAQVKVRADVITQIMPLRERRPAVRAADVAVAPYFTAAPLRRCARNGAGGDLGAGDGEVGRGGPRWSPCS